MLRMMRIIQIPNPNHPQPRFTEKVWFAVDFCRAIARSAKKTYAMVARTGAWDVEMFRHR